MQYINNNLRVLLYKAGLDLGLQFVTDLQTHCDKFVVELISRSLKQVVTPCYKVDDSNRLTIQVVTTKLIHESLFVTIL